jgi:hypothetical protein
MAAAVDFPACPSSLIAFITPYCGRFWCETGAAPFAVLLPVPQRSFVKLVGQRTPTAEIKAPSPADHRAEPDGSSKPSFSCSREARTESAGSFPRSAFFTVWRFPSTQRACFRTKTSLGPRPPLRMAQLLLSGGKQPTARLANAQAPVLSRPWPVKEELPVTALQGTRFAGGILAYAARSCPPGYPNRLDLGQARKTNR